MDYEQHNNLLKGDPRIIANAMERHMLKDMKRIVPKLVPWLLKLAERRTKRKDFDHEP